MFERPKTAEAIIWGRIVTVIGYLYFFGSIIAGAVLLTTTDSYCDYITECSFLEKRPYTLIGLPLFFSGLTFGAPMIAIGLYMTAQLRIQKYRLEINSPS